MREEILGMIEKNSRIALSEIAACLNTTEPEVANELEAMENEGIINGYYALIDWDKVTEERIHALIEVRVTPQRGKGFDEIAERIYNYPEVTATYLISGGFDLLVFMEGRTLKEISSFVYEKLSTMDFVLSTTTHFVLRKYKDHGIIVGGSSEDERMIMTP